MTILLFIFGDKMSESSDVYVSDIFKILDTKICEILFLHHGLSVDHITYIPGKSYILYQPEDRERVIEIKNAITRNLRNLLIDLKILKVINV